ncbi:hypothetical protein BJF78_14025 [Pseudonocardia sp. CNS-139]|nr:hypothetical protein BJF78_14025 [Pseudonocardia sp. CNS-139]
MTVLVLARDIDSQVDRVAAQLATRDVPVFRTFLAAFPQSLTLDTRLGPDGWDGELAGAHSSVRLSDIRSVWYRQPSHFEFPAGMSSSERRHAAGEARSGFSGTLSRVNVPWVNHPARIADAVKPAQLAVARACGLRVPATLVTNRPESVRRFAVDVGGPLAVKSMSAAVLAEAGGVKVVFTRRLDPAELDDLRGVETTMHLFQEFIEPKAFEARVTVVRDRIFAAAIHASSDASKVDFRADYDSLTYTIIEPPGHVTTGMLAFMRAFGLLFGAFDFAVTPGGRLDHVRMQSGRGVRMA